MENNLLIRDLKLEPVIGIMGGDSDEVKSICRNRLLSGLLSIEAINHYQNQLMKMLSNDSETKEIYELTNEIFQAIIPYKNYLNPQTVSYISLQQKLNVHLNICITISEGLQKIYKIQHRTKEYHNIENRITELKKLLSYGENRNFHLEGGIGEGFHIAEIKIRNISSEANKPGFPFLSKRKKKKSDTTEALINMGAEISRIQDAVCHSLLQILISYEKRIEKDLAAIREDYGYAIGAKNLQQFLKTKGVPVCWPQFQKKDKILHVEKLTELSILQQNIAVRGNYIHLSDKQVCIITGANQGGKTTFLRSIGQAQLMAQSGLFTAAESYSTEYHQGIFTHFPDEESETMQSGLLDSELRKLDQIVEQMHDSSMLLMNESFQTTTEYNGCDISNEIISGFQQTGVKLFFVTHNYLFASRLYEQKRKNIIFLKASITENQERAYIIKEGIPERSAHAEKLYRSYVSASIGQLAGQR